MPKPFATKPLLDSKQAKATHSILYSTRCMNYNSTTKCMTNKIQMPISIRLSPDQERQLNEEARISRKTRSDLVREAVGDYLTRREKARMIEAMKTAAQDLYSNAKTVEHDQQIQTDFDNVDDTLKEIESEEQAHDPSVQTRWWK